MGAHAGLTVSERDPEPPERGHVQSAGLFILENLAIVAGYVLLGWLGNHLWFSGRLPITWPVGGFALAMLVLRGASRGPAILLGAVLVSEAWLLKSGVPSSLQGHTSALMMGVVAALSAMVGAQIVRWRLGTGGWPLNVRGVGEFIVTAALIYPVIATGVSLFSMRLSGNTALVPFRDVWIWFIAHSTGSLIVAPLFLVLGTSSRAIPRRSPWEAALLSLLYLVGCLSSFWLARRFGVSGLLAYPPTFLLPWAVFRFGSRGAVFHCALLAAVIISFVLSVSGTEGLTAAFLQLQARLVVLSVVVLLLAAAVEERHQLGEALEKARRELERRVVERTHELARSLSLLHSSLESTADGLLVVDRQGRITATNQRFAELWGIPHSLRETGDDRQLLAFALKQVADPDRFLSRVQYLYEHPELESEDELELKDGRSFERFSRPQRLDEEIIGRVWSFRDVTLRRRAEAERDRLLVQESRARQAAEQAFRETQRALGLRDEFLGVAAHEMKTPLTSMKAQIQSLEQLLAREPAAPIDASRLRSVIANASRQLKRFQTLSDQLLDITRLSMGRIELNYEPLDFRELVTEQFGYQAEAASRAGSELRFECPEPIPGEWDRRRLEHIVYNLLSNAIKFGAGSPIRLRLEAVANRVRLQVIDRGIGIAPEDHERIFERLERAVDSRHYGGLGLGLWVAQRSAEELGGSITVESELGKGSCFTVELPRVRPSFRRESQPLAQEEQQPA
jgi:PAS domain S-box-containing protein